jgi:hypothetical protein
MAASPTQEETLLTRVESEQGLTRPQPLCHYEANKLYGDVTINLSLWLIY